jgi:hypothetical protein
MPWTHYSIPSGRPSAFAIPLLGAGKVDLMKARALAAQGTEAASLS